MLTLKATHSVIYHTSYLNDSDYSSEGTFIQKIHSIQYWMLHNISFVAVWNENFFNRLFIYFKILLN
jgi:hypothetical protein